MKRRLMIAAAALLAAMLAAWAAFDRVPRLPEPSAQLLQAQQGLEEISIAAALDPEARTLGVRQTLRLTNRTGQRQNAVVLRTWPNVFQSLDTSTCAVDDGLYDLYYPDGFSTGALVMIRAQVNGETVLYRYTDTYKTVLSVPVPGGWEAGETALLQLEYVVQIPRMAYRFGVWENVFALGNAFAIPAVWQDGAFRTDPYLSVGDPFVSDCANYSVRVTVPEDYVCAGSGYPTVEKNRAERTYCFEAPAVRDFALVISDRLEQVSQLQNGVLVTAYASTASQARQLVRSAGKALRLYASLWGEYPYQSFTLAQIHFPHGGMEYPALAMIGADEIVSGGRKLEYTVAHETAHQWWYSLVGSDGWHQPWQDEALCEFALLEYAEAQYGAGERDDLEQSRVESAMRVTVPQGVTPGSPLSAFADMSEYSLVVYSRGAAYLCALDRTLPDGINPFLRDYAQSYAFTRATRDDFEDQLAKSTGEDFAALTRDYLDTYILN